MTTDVQPQFLGVYWRLFWNAQRSTRTHLFRVPATRGYGELSPEEGRALCGEAIPNYYREGSTEGAWVCKRCERKRAKLLANT